MADNVPAPGTDDPLALEGVIPPTVTAFDEDGAVDPDATGAHAEFVVEAGAKAVFPLGTNGEFPLLSAKERATVIEGVREAVDVPVIAGVGAPSTRRTCRHAARAEAAGADGLVVVTPYYYPIDGQGMVQHYRTITEQVDLPVYVYHIPGKTGNSLSLETLGQLVALDGIAGVKDSSKDVPWLAEALDSHPNVTFLVGSDSILFTGLEIGCAGLISAVANVFPDLVVDLYDAYDHGDEARASELQSTVFDVRSALKRGPYMAGVKTALSLRDVDFDVGDLRPPLRTMSEDDREALAADLDSLDLL